MNRVFERLQQRGNAFAQRSHDYSGDVGRSSTSGQSNLPAVPHPVLRRGTGSIGLTVTQPATGLHPFTRSEPRTQTVLATSRRRPLNVHSVPQANGRHFKQTRLLSVPEDATYHRAKGHLGSHLLPPIQPCSQETDEHTKEVKTAEIDVSSEDDEEDDEEEEEEVIVVSPHDHLETLLKIQFPPCGDPHSIFPATIYQCHMFLDHQAAMDDKDFFGPSQRTKNIVRAFSIHGPVDVGILRRCLSRVSQLHPLLKVRFLQGKERVYLQVSTGEPALQFTIKHGYKQALATVLRQEVHRPFQLTIGTLSESDEEMLQCAHPSKDMRVISLEEEDGSEILGQKQCHSQLSRDHSQPKVTSHLLCENGPKTYLFRSHLLSHDSFDHTIILTFPRIVCDVWSASLFVRQLAAAYAIEERHPTADSSIRNKALLKKWSKNFLVKPKPLTIASHKMGKLSGQDWFGGESERFNALASSQLKFKQVALRELELSVSLSKERLWSLWETSATKVVKNHLGIQKIKTVPHVKLPTHLKDEARTQSEQTSTSLKWKLADTSRQQTTLFKFLKVDEVAAECFLQMLPRSQCPYMDPNNFLYFMCLGCYAILLARCCRGWNGNHQPQLLLPTVHEDGLDGSRRRGSTSRRPSARQPSARRRRSRLMSAHNKDMMKASIMLTSPPGSGHFLIGTELSLRHFTSYTDGLFGPLSNDSFVRVNLSQCTTFLDLINSLSHMVNSLHQQIHFPFASVAGDINLPQSLPVRFHYLNRHDVLQLASPDDFYFSETAVGVTGQGLARLGTNCYLSPISGQLDKDCHMELVLWENTDNDGLGGGFRYQPHLVPSRAIDSLIKAFAELIESVADHPAISLNDLVAIIKPPFLPTRRQRIKSSIRREHTVIAT